MKEIHIQPVLNGFIVEIGCLKVVFTSIDTLCSELKNYYANPVEVEKWYREHAINDVETPTGEPAPVLAYARGIRA